MNDPATESARDDLAFVRQLMSESGQVQDSLGQALLAGGACYGVQCLIQAWLATGINSVPAIVVNRTYLISGGQPPEVFETQLREMAARED